MMPIPTSARRARRTRRPFAVGLALLVAAATATACANEADETSAANPTPTSVPTETTADEPSLDDPAEPSPPSPPETDPPETDPPEPAPPQTDAPAALMPNVVCMNLQDAQDRIQEEGVFYSRSHDATGEGRMQIVDSNWVVVTQDPAPGTPIGEGDADLGAVKYGETSQC